jgi:hypothetical protein
VREVTPLDDSIGDTLVSNVRQEVFSTSIDFSGLAGLRKAVRRRHGDTAVNTKVWQYYRPIARPTQFWLNGSSFISQARSYLWIDDF